MSVTSSKSQQSFINHTRVQEVPQLLPPSDKSITHEEKGWDEQWNSKNSRRLKRKAASSGLNSFGYKCPTNSTYQTHQLGNPNKKTIDAYRRRILTSSEPGLHLNSSLKDDYNTRFTSEEPNDWKNIKSLSRVPSITSYSSDILPSSYAHKPGPFSARLSDGNLTDVSTISLSRFPHPPRLGCSRVNHSAASFEPEDNQPLLPFASPTIIQFANGTFDVLNPHESLYDTMIEHPEEEENGNTWKPSFAIFQEMQPLGKAPEQSGEVDTDSCEGSIRPRPLYDDLNSAYQSITSRKSDAYNLQAEPPFQLKSQLQASSTLKHFTPTADEKDLTASDTQITSKGKRESNPRFLQRVVRAFSMRRSASDNSIAQINTTKHRSKNRKYLSDIFSSNRLEMEEHEKTIQRDVTSNDIDIEIGRRRPIPASFDSLFDWTDDESNYPPSVYYRNSFSYMGTSSQGTNLWSMGDNDYSIEFGSSPYMQKTTTNDYREDGLSISEGIEPRIESTIGSILNRYDHGRESSQAISSAISNSKSSISSNANCDDQHAAEDGNAHEGSIISYRRPMSKLLPPPLLQRVNPAYSGHPPQFSLPTPNARTYRSNLSTRPEWSVPSNLYSTSSSYGNTRDLLLISQSATSVCPTEMSDLAFIALSSRESGTKARTETGISCMNETAISRVIDCGTNVFNSHSDRLPGQQPSPHAAAFPNETLNETVNSLSWDKGTTKVKPYSNETAICKALDYNNNVEVQRSAEDLESNCEAFQSTFQKGENLHDRPSQNQAVKSRRKSAEDGADFNFNRVDDHLDDHTYEDNESQDWETVAEPSQPNFTYEGLPRSHYTDDNKLRSEGGENIAVFNHIYDDSPLQTEYARNGLDPFNNDHVLREANEIYQNNPNATAYIPDFTSLVAEPHDDIEYNIGYSWKGIADHAQAYNNRKIDDSAGQDKLFSDSLLQNTENQNFAANNDMTSTSGLILQSSPIEGNVRHTLRRTKNFEFIEQSLRPNESCREAGQQLHSGDLLINNCRSAQPSQIYIPPRYKSLKPENLVLQKDIVHHDESRVGLQPSQVVAQEEKYLPGMSLVPKNRRKRASVPSQTRLMSFSLTSRDKLLLKSPTSHGSRNSNFGYRTHRSSTSSPRKFDSAPCLRRRNATAAVYSNSDRRLKLKLSLLLFGVCCFFPPALVCYGVGWMDPVILSLSRGKVEHVGRTQKRIALLLGTFVCTVGVVITITVIVMLHLEKT